eukprot:RCo013053
MRQASLLLGVLAVVVVLDLSAGGWGVAGARYCPRCRFTAVSRDGGGGANGGADPPVVEYKMTTMRGFGRTGNAAIAMFNALGLGYICRGRVELPEQDDFMGTFVVQARHRRLDFTQAPPEPGAKFVTCRSITSGTRDFFYKTGEMARLGGRVKRQLMNCLRHYLGFCVPGYCDGQDTSEGTLVAHIRQGDVYLNTFRPPQGYGQPSLAYYLSILNFTRPRKTIFVYEPQVEGPVLKALRLHARFGLLPGKVQFQTKIFREDLRTMICASAFVESRSTLMHTTQLGFARRIFSTRCRAGLLPGSMVYRVTALGNYERFFHDHGNTREEQLESLLTWADPPVACGRSGFQILYVEDSLRGKVQETDAVW